MDTLLLRSLAMDLLPLGNVASLQTSCDDSSIADLDPWNLKTTEWAYSNYAGFVIQMFDLGYPPVRRKFKC